MSTAAGHFARKFQEAHRTVTTDRECVECGYNLRGLKVGGNCPECGALIEPPLAKDHPLSRMPWRVLRVFLVGAWVAVASVMLAVTSLWLAVFGLITWEVMSIGVAVLSPLWVMGLWMLTPAFGFPEAQLHGFSRRSPLRTWARRSQIAWIFAAAIFAAETVAAPAGAIAIALAAGFWIAVIIGGGGAIALAVLLENLAEWVRDTTAKRFLNVFEWASPAGLILWWLVHDIEIGRIIIGGWGMVAIGLFPAAIMLLAKSITFSWQHQVEEISRNQRRSARAKRDAARIDARLRAIDQAARDRAAHRPGDQR